MNPAGRNVVVVALVGLAACGGKKAEPAPTQAAATVDAQRAVAPIDAAPLIDAAPARPGGFAASAEDRAYAATGAWGEAWLAAMAVPPAGAPRDPAWPCRAVVDVGMDGTADEEYAWSFGGPAACKTPPDQVVFGCPLTEHLIDRTMGSALETDKAWAYDAAGHLVAVRRSNRLGTTRIVWTWAGDDPAVADMDTNPDGVAEEHARYTRSGDALVFEQRQPDGGFKLSATFRYQGDRLVENAKKFQTTTYAWDGGRVVSAEVVKGGKPVARTTYAYDCP